MNEIALLKEERKEIQAEIDRLRGSMNRADNGVKHNRIVILSRTLSRIDREIAVLENRRASA
ncbi:hypothetical protein [Shinella sp.]|jgi:uncharacterized coiled-coil DUF342 family protein|uniref:hypothetical protein n=1 Tax=Shinella sp. TaxID=1870904 RepID=UPI003F6F1B96